MTTSDKSDGPPLVPPDVRYIAWALAFAAFVVAIWRGRRLGPGRTGAAAGHRARGGDH